MEKNYFLVSNVWTMLRMENFGTFFSLIVPYKAI